LACFSSYSKTRSSRKAWELKLDDTVDYSRYRELDQFLASHIRHDCTHKCRLEKPQTTSKRKTLVFVYRSILVSIMQSELSIVSMFSIFLYSSSKRFEFIKTQKRCVNCFSTKHAGEDCTNSRACRQCSKRHHTLLHFDNSIKPVDIKQPSTSAPTNSENVTVVATHLLVKTVAPKSYSRRRECEFIRLINILSLCVRFWIKDSTVRLSPNRLLNAYAFRKLIAPFPLSALTKCSPCITLPNYDSPGVLRRTYLYYDRLYFDH